MLNPKHLTVRDVLDIIFEDTSVQIFADAEGKIVVANYCEQLKDKSSFEDEEILDIESGIADGKPTIMINIEGGRRV